MKVKKNTLLLIAALVWTAAGWNVARIGILTYPRYLSITNIFLSILVFCIFQKFIFGRLVEKHTKRITEYQEDYKYFWNFFDLKAFILMAIMMSGGIFLRAARLVPERFIAVFYSGLGISLLLAGVLFGKNFIRAIHMETTK